MLRPAGISPMDGDENGKKKVPGKQSFGKDLGWSCPQGQAICGIKTRNYDPARRDQRVYDSVGLSGVYFKCCVKSGSSNKPNDHSFKSHHFASDPGTATRTLINSDSTNTGNITLAANATYASETTNAEKSSHTGKIKHATYASNSSHAGKIVHASKTNQHEKTLNAGKAARDGDTSDVVSHNGNVTKSGNETKNKIMSISSTNL